MCDSWGGLPFEGGVMEQPLRLLVLGADLRNYARAFAIYKQDRERAPDSVKMTVLLTGKDSADMRRSGL